MVRLETRERRITLIHLTGDEQRDTPHSPPQSEGPEAIEANYQSKRPPKALLKNPEEDDMFAEALARVHAGEDRASVAQELVARLPGRKESSISDKLKTAVVKGSWT